MSTISLNPEQIHWIREKLKEKLDHDTQTVYKGNYDAYEGDVEKINDEIGQKIEEDVYGDLQGLRNDDLICTEYLLRKVFFQSRQENHMNFYTKSLAILTLYIQGKVLSKIPELPIEKTRTFSQESEQTKFADNSGNMVSMHLNKNMSDTSIQSEVENAQSEILIQETYLENWFRLKDVVKDAVQRGVKLRILLSDPDSEFVKLRYKALDLPFDSRKAHNQLSDLASSLEKWDASWDFEVRITKNILGNYFYKFDEKLYSGWFWYKRVAPEGEILALSEDHQLGNAFSKHFEDLWLDANPLSLENYLKEFNSYEPPSSHLLRVYVGDWYIYCNRKSGKTESYRVRSMSSGEVARNILSISENEDNSFSCTFKSSYLMDHHGTVNLAANKSFFTCELENKEGNSRLFFTVHRGNGLGDNLVGIYNNMYASEPILGSGLIALERIKEDPEGFKDLEPKMIDPFDPKELNENTKRFVRYLTYTLGTRLEPIKDDAELRRNNKYGSPCPYAGLYYVYAYQRGSKNKDVLISRGVLQITEFYTARLRRKRSRNQLSLGVVDLVNERQLIISLENIRNKQIGYFIFGSKVDSAGNEELMGGVFSGFANRSSGPWVVGNRIVLERVEGKTFETMQETNIKMHSPEYYELKEGIRLNLTGRVNNMIGFIRQKAIISNTDLIGENKDEVDPGELFFESACQKALNGKTHLCAEMILRAVRHAFIDWEKFVRQIKLWEEKGLIRTGFFNDLRNDVNYQKAEEIIQENESLPLN